MKLLKGEIMDYNQQMDYNASPEYYYNQAQPYTAVPQYDNQYSAEYPIVNSAVNEKGTLKSWFDLTDKNYLKGLLLGAGVAVVFGHPRVRKAIISGAVSTWDAVSCGFEELKEQVEDVRAEKNTQDK